MVGGAEEGSLPLYQKIFENFMQKSCILVHYLYLF